jgi:hypothetical protein
MFLPRALTGLQWSDPMIASVTKVATATFSLLNSLFFNLLRSRDSRTIPLEHGLQFHGKVIAQGAQTERQGDAGLMHAVSSVESPSAFPDTVFSPRRGVGYGLPRHVPYFLLGARAERLQGEPS